MTSRDFFPEITSQRLFFSLPLTKIVVDQIYFVWDNEKKLVIKKVYDFFILGTW